MLSRRPKRQQAVKKFNLADQTLRINLRKCNYEKFRFSEIEDYVRELVGDREYQFQAIKEIMTYLWGGGYNSIEDLAQENFANNTHIQQEHGSIDLLLSKIPLQDRLSGVVHMATGTGKSFVIFAIAYLSIIMGYTKRALVLGPPSLVIEKGLRDKFSDLLNKKELLEKLPVKYRNRPINLFTDNDAIEDYSIIVENINAVFTFGSIQDMLFRNTEEVLVLSDEVHHAYSHLIFKDKKLVLDKEEKAEDSPNEKITENKQERLWMQFLLGKGRFQKPQYFQSGGKHKIIRHIGFTGTPYNADDFFADVIFNYSIKTAIEEKYIKKINPIIRIETEEGNDLTPDQRYNIILEKHNENKEKYSFKDNKGKLQVKPITLFICSTQASARKRREEFTELLKKKHKKINKNVSNAELYNIVSEKSILVTCNNPEKEYKEKLEHIEELNIKKVGGSVEFIFAVNKLSEGWDVENIFQIVPMEERVFKSKLLISQVLGRGLRIPRKVPNSQILQNYPMVTITNHERFAEHIRELLDAVTQSDMSLMAEALPPDKDNEKWRGNKNFTLFNLNYIPNQKIEDRIDDDLKNKSLFQRLKLTPFNEEEDVKITFLQGEQKYSVIKNTKTVDYVVDDISQRFRRREHEKIRFDFGDGEQIRCPTEEEIRKVIIDAKNKAGIKGNKLSEENRQQINLYFNKYLPPSKQRRIFDNIEGNVEPIETSSMNNSSIRVSELDHDTTVFLSENYLEEVGEKNKMILDYLTKYRAVPEYVQSQKSLFEDLGFIEQNREIIRTCVDGYTKSPFVVNVSVFKNPQSLVIVSHVPERDFVFKLLKFSEYIDVWIKSIDKGFYSLGYEFWKGGKDRVRRAFNPDFFIKIELDKYIKVLESKDQTEYLFELKDLQNKGVREVIHVVEIKSDDDRDEATSAKEQCGKEHFKALNIKLLKSELGNLENKYIKKSCQYYVFDLLTPQKYFNWFSALEKGNIMIDWELFD